MVSFLTEKEKIRILEDVRDNRIPIDPGVRCGIDRINECEGLATLRCCGSWLRIRTTKGFLASFDALELIDVKGVKQVRSDVLVDGRAIIDVQFEPGWFQDLVEWFEGLE